MSSRPSPTDATVVIHPRALCETDEIGEGTRVWAFAHLLRGAVIGRDCNIGDHVYIESGARIGNRVTLKNQVMVWEGVTIDDDVFVGPGVIFTNDRRPRSPRMVEARERYAKKENWLGRTTVGRGASIGAGSTLLCGITIGPYAMIGAGTLVTHNVSDHRLIVGHPGRPVGWVCCCGRQLQPDLQCVDCRRRYRLTADALAQV